MIKEPHSVMTVQKLFDAVKSSPMDVIFSFSSTGKRYALSAISVGVLDPVIQKFRGAIIVCFDPLEKVREDRYHFKWTSAKVYVWAYAKPKTKQSKFN